MARTGDPEGAAGVDGGSAQAAVAVVSWNTRELLERCLHSLAEDARSGRAEVWVVDNASQDGSPEMVRESFGWVRLIASAENVGFGPAVNLVAARTSAPWIAAANADIALTPGSLTRLLATGESFPQAGAVAPRLVLPDGRTQHSVYSFPTLPFALLFNSGLPDLSPRLADHLALEGRWNSERPRFVPWALGAFLLIRRSAWDEVGGFDESQWMYAEDLDLGWRLARGGWSTRYEPQARVLHEASAAASRAWGEERHARWMHSTYAWMLRRRGVARTRATALVNITGAAWRAPALVKAARHRGSPWSDGLRDSARWIRLHAIGLAPRAALERHR